MARLLENQAAQLLKEASTMAGGDVEGFASVAFPIVRRVFAGSPIKRTGRDRFVRNVLIAIGNSGNSDLTPCAEGLTEDPSTIVATAARWAVEQLEALDGLSSAD